MAERERRKNEGSNKSFLGSVADNKSFIGGG
jgi:hypothetical protein